MGSRPPLFRPPGQQTKRERDQQHDQRRGSASSRGYDSRWSKASAGHRRRSPLCRYCELADRVTAAELTDHLYPWRTYREHDLFWVNELWVSSCTECHNGFKQRIEHRGRAALDALAVQLGLPTLAELRLPPARDWTGGRGQSPGSLR